MQREESFFYKFSVSIGERSPTSYPSNKKLKSLEENQLIFFPFMQWNYVKQNNRMIGCMENLKSPHFHYWTLLSQVHPRSLCFAVVLIVKGFVVTSLCLKSQNNKCSELSFICLYWCSLWETIVSQVSLVLIFLLWKPSFF